MISNPTYSSVSAFLAGTGAFVIVSAPSLKLIYSTPIVNGLGGVLLFLAVLICPPKRLGREQVGLLSIWILVAIVLLLGFIRIGPSELSELLRYIYLLTVTAIAIAAVNQGSARWLAYCLMGWGVVLGLWQLILGVPTSGELGQHYLTISFPLAASLSGFIAVAFFSRCTTTVRMVSLAVAMILLMSLLTLLSRSGVLFPILLFLVATVVFLMGGNWRGRGSAFVALVLFVVSSLTVVFVYGSFEVDARQLDRLLELATAARYETRVPIYLDAFSYVAQRPFVGYGTVPYSTTTDLYPHNVFLDLLLHGGLVLMLIFTPLLLLFLVRMWRGVASGKPPPTVLFLGFYAAYAFLQWNTSFNLATIYVPLILMLSFSAAMRFERGGVRGGVYKAKRLPGESLAEYPGGVAGGDNNG